MSLHDIARHLAAKGRGPDTTLVHMTEGEVKSLQDIAKAHGGSLTINPQTGMPEAGFLSSILPMVAGAGLMAMGVPNPLLAAAIVGGGSMVLNPNQSLGKGLMTGLSAYGGATLGEALAMEGVKTANPVVTEAAKTGAAAAPVPVNDGLTMFSQRGVSAPSYVNDGLSSFNQLPQAAPINIAPVTPVTPAPASLLGTPTEPIGMTNDMARETLSNMSSAERAGAMAEGFTGKNLANFANQNKIMSAGMVAGPLLASQTSPEVPTVPVDRDPGQQYDYYPGIALPTPSADPYGREKTYYSGYFRPRTTTAADGGMMGWPAGESVIKMAGGGVPKYDMGGFVVDAVNNILQQDPRFRQLMGLDANAPIKKYTYDQQNQKYLENGVSTPSEAPRNYNYDAQNQQFTAQVPPTTPMASGGISDLRYNLGGYSDGGRLLRGPGDGVSDSIPATIANKQPARLADGEFVVPARIVSELGNGSTEAGARKLYAMMDRVQKARSKTVGEGKVAKNSNAAKYLPA